MGTAAQTRVLNVHLVESELPNRSQDTVERFSAKSMSSMTDIVVQTRAHSVKPAETSLDIAACLLERKPKLTMDFVDLIKDLNVTIADSWLLCIKDIKIEIDPKSESY